MTTARKNMAKLDPAHVRVLDLIILPQGMKRPGHVNVDFLIERTFWSEASVRTLLLEARRHFDVHTTHQLMILWREKRKL